MPLYAPTGYQQPAAPSPAPVAREAAQRSNAITGTDSDILIEEVRALGTAYGLQKNIVDDMEHRRKVIIAQVIEDYREKLLKENREKEAADRVKVTETMLDNLARAGSRYVAFLDMLKEEKDALTHIQEQYFSKRNTLDLLLEQMKLARAEMHYIQTSNNL